MLVGISGHQRLPQDDDWEWVRGELVTCLRATPALVGVSSLAIGADTLFARVVLELGGLLSVVLPFHDYENRFNSPEERVEYRTLVRQASTIEVLHRSGADEEAYYAAGRRVADLSELLIVVWNGKPAGGLGGTADIVKYARQRGKRMVWLNPSDRTKA